MWRIEGVTASGTLIIASSLVYRTTKLTVPPVTRTTNTPRHCLFVVCSIFLIFLASSSSSFTSSCMTLRPLPTALPTLYLYPCVQSVIFPFSFHCVDLVFSSSFSSSPIIFLLIFLLILFLIRHLSFLLFFLLLMNHTDKGPRFVDMFLCYRSFRQLLDTCAYTCRSTRVCTT